MKKTYIILALLIFIGIGMSSCKSHQACPAYGSVETEQEATA